MKTYSFQKWTCLFLSAVLVFTTSCITTPGYEDKNLELPPSLPGLQNQTTQGLKVESLIYLPSQLPLETFFSKLKQGEFTKAFKKIDLKYKSTNANNEALEQLIDHGFIPVYLEVTNTSPEPITLQEGHFWLADEDQKYQGIASTELPLRFKKLSAPAITANVINTSVLVVGVVAVLAAFVIVASQANGSPGRGDWPQMFGEDPYVVNNMHLTTRVNYNNYLISKKELQPGETKKGILFFAVKDSSDVENLKISYKAN